jgi:hypothetical protein
MYGGDSGLAANTKGRHLSFILGLLVIASVEVANAVGNLGRRTRTRPLGALSSRSIASTSTWNIRPCR